MARNKMFYFRCSEEELEEIKLKAERKGKELNLRLTMSDYIRHLIKADKISP